MFIQGGHGAHEPQHAVDEAPAALGKDLRVVADERREFLHALRSLTHQHRPPR